MKSILVLSSVAAARAAILQPSPASSPDPTITTAPHVPIELLRKQNGNRFMGWISLQNGWTTGQCETGGTLYQSGDYWRCCATTVASCAIPLGCISGSLIYPYSTSGTTIRTSYACSSLYTDPEDKDLSLCNTGFMYENTADSSPQTNIFCGNRASNWSYYRSKPADAETSSRSSSSPATTPASTPASPTGASAPTTPPLPPPQQTEKKGSKAWIAGAVVGPIVGIALIGILAFFLIRRKKKNSATAAAGGAGATAAPATVPPSSYPGSPQQGYYQPMQQQNNGAGFVPYGVGVQEHYGANENKHQSWAQPPPHSPEMQSNTPYTQPQQPYPYAQNGGLQPTGSPPPTNAQPQFGVPPGQTPETQFTNELPAEPVAKPAEDTSVKK